jgi:hypothetical protein
MQEHNTQSVTLSQGNNLEFIRAVWLPKMSALLAPEGRLWRAARAFRDPLENPPHKVRQQRKQQQHKHPANPYQKVHRHLRRVDLFLIHA